MAASICQPIFMIVSSSNQQAFSFVCEVMSGIQTEHPASIENTLRIVYIPVFPQPQDEQTLLTSPRHKLSCVDWLCALSMHQLRSHRGYHSHA